MAHGSLIIPFRSSAGSVLKPMDSGKRSAAGFSRPLKSPGAGTVVNSSEKRARRKVKSFKLPRASAEIVDSGSCGSKSVSKDSKKINGQYNGDCSNWNFSENGNDLLLSRLKAYHNRCEEEIADRNAGLNNFYKEFARYVDQVWMELALAHKYYDKAFLTERRNAYLLIEYAEFVWKRLKNVEMAIELVEKAVLVHDYGENVEVWGLYALLMWEADDF